MNNPSPLGIADHLLAYDVPLVIIGGHAVNVHGYARATEDVDIVFRRTPQTEQQLYDGLDKIHAYWIGNDVDPATGIETVHPITMDYLRKHHLMMLGTDLGFLDLFDFIPSMPDESVEELFSSAIQRDGRPYASLGWIRRMKAAADRPIDRMDLENLPLE